MQDPVGHSLGVLLSSEDWNREKAPLDSEYQLAASIREVRGLAQ
jgi:hypothetical protein